MPFTPYHLGAGALFKGIGGNRFSFLVFGGTQVLIDIEPAYRMIVGDAVLHGPTHTFYGAIFVGGLATLCGKPISEFVLSRGNYSQWRISWAASATSAFLGTFSHLFLDGIMHSDMSPWAPFIVENPLLGLMSLDALHLLCIGSGLAGTLLIVARRLYNRESRRSNTSEN